MTIPEQLPLLDLGAEPDPAPGRAHADTVHVSNLHVHRAGGARTLATALAGVLGTPLADPFATEVICVPTPGVERWLSQTLAGHLGVREGRRDGICAGIDYQRLDRMIERVIQDALGIDPARDPWDPASGVWSLMRVLDECQEEPWLTPIRAHFRPDSPGAHRYATAARVFGLFASYATQRPGMLDSWREGRAVDATGAELPAYTAWQARLWMRLRAELATPELAGPDPGERCVRAAAALAEDPGLCTLPPRLSVFGPTRLSTQATTVLEALARHRQVHLWLTHPSPALWDEVATTPVGPPGPRRDDPTALVPRHRLNARLARDNRELQLCLAPLPAHDLLHPGEAPGRGTLLGRLQGSIADDVAAPEQDHFDTRDDSIRFHACHGPDRQVEVLREIICALLADDPDLEPRDIIVMCPDIETFAPLISAAFMIEDLPDQVAHPGQRLRVRLADRSLRQLNPLLDTLARLLELGESRAGVSMLLDLCAQQPVARKFGFVESDLERLQDLVTSSGIRWGLDARHRGRFQMSGFGQNTWQAGMDRMLLGIGLSEDGQHYRGTVFPLDDVDSADVDLIGRLSELVDRVRRVTDSFAVPQPLSQWMLHCREALELLTEVPVADNWQLSHAWSALAEIADSAQTDSPAADVVLTPGDVRALLADEFAGRPSRANFRTGSLTMCTMTPMRSVPHRVVCLLGLDDGVFPRRVFTDGDDLLAADPWIGDRDARSEDRQVLLDAIMAAGEKLVVIYGAASQQTGSPRPPCVPLLEVREAIAELVPPGIDPWRSLEVHHPLQPFGIDNFTGEVPFSFDPMALAGAQALTDLGVRTAAGDPSARAPVFTREALPPLPAFAADRVSIELSDLIGFFRHPIKALLRRRAGLYASDDPDVDEDGDEIPIELDGLQQWQLGERMLQQHLRGVPLVDIREAELRRGAVPPRARGYDVLTEVARKVLAITDATQPWRGEPPRGGWVRAEVGRYTLGGMVSGIRGTSIVHVQYSRVSGRHRLASWLELLALKATHPDVAWRAVTVGRGGQGTVLGPMSEVDARARLSELIGVYARGCDRPLMVPPNSAAVQAAIGLRGASPGGLYDTWKYECDAAWKRFGVERITDLNAVPATAEDGGGSNSQFEALAYRVWGPLLDAEHPL